jgi:hypothetical protein
MNADLGGRGMGGMQERREVTLYAVPTARDRLEVAGGNFRLTKALSEQLRASARARASWPHSIHASVHRAGPGFSSRSVHG